MLLYLWMMLQIICESLPISSSGHALLLQQYCQRYQFDFGLQGYDIIAFDYMLQGLSAIVIFAYFFPLWWQLIVQKPIAFKNLLEPNLWKKIVPHLFLFGFVADGATFLLWNYGIVEKIYFPVACGFMITAIVLWSLQYAHEKKDIFIWSWQNGLMVGCAQGIALFPGISRFAVTIVTLQWLGYQGRVAFMISFLLQWPLIVAGSLKGFLSVQDPLIIQTMMSFQFLTGAVVAGFLSYKLLSYVGKMIDNNLLWNFSYYMIIPTVIAFMI